jgi:hypothetical protein
MTADHGPDPRSTRLTRRTFLQAGAAAAGAAVLGPPALTAASAEAATLLVGQTVARAAMHVHASSSEGVGSWEQQYANAAAQGLHVLWQTDHDFRARAMRYMTRLAGTWLPSTTGSWQQHAASFSAAGPIRVMVAAAGATAATQQLVMQDSPTAFNTFRTGIQGQSLTVAFGSSRLDAAGRFEIVVGLSLHPAQAGRPAGRYSLRYRWAPGAVPARFREGGGLVGVVRAPMPANGATVTLTPEADIRAIWPDMLAVDNCSFLLSFVATSPRSGVVADVNLRSVTVARPQHTAAGVRAAQEAIAARWSARYGLLGIPSEELSLLPERIAHWNVFGAPPEWALKDDLDLTNWQPYYRDYGTRVHARGGVVSWNHPLGFSAGPLLSPAEQLAQRRARFAEMSANDLLGADLLEVGYAVRGHQPFTQHLALWDTFSRHARFLTGNGVTDDHSGNGWTSLNNGFVTGIWVDAIGEAQLVAALGGGRAFTYHPRQCPQLRLDTLTDGTAAMGAVSVATRATRTVAIQATGLPADSTVELVRGPVDLTGQDPGTTVLASLPASRFTGSGTVSVSVPTGLACFVRPQVRRAGALVASGNPTWLLRSAPPGGIPPSRAA